MKRIFCTVTLLVLILNNISLAQTVYSNGTGGGVWNETGTWLGGVVPNSSNDVIISGGDSVNTTVGAECKSLTVYSDGKFATSIDTVYVVETLSLEADAYFYNQTSNPTLPGSDYYLDPQSYVVHIGSGTVGGEGNLEFGNLIIQRNAGAVPGGNLIIHGNLIVNNTASNVVFRGVRPQTGSQTHIVEGDLHIYKGTFSCIDVGDNGMVGIWNILGNVYLIDDSEPYLEARMGPFSSSNAAGLGIINIGGDLIVQGGRLQGGTSSSPGTGNGIFNVGGNVSLDINSGVATNTLGSVSFNFVGNSTQYVNLDNKFQMGTAIYDTIVAGSSVVFDLDTNKWGSTTGGEFVVDGSLEMVDSSFLDGPGSFILNPGATLKIGSPYGIVTTGFIGNIQMVGGFNFSEDANYEYKSSVPQLLGDALPSTVSGLTINNPTGVVVDKNLSINNSLKIVSGTLDLNSKVISLGSNATLSETPGNTVIGSTGKITITKDINSPSELNVGGLGAVLTSASNMGNTTIERTHAPGSGGSNQGIKRIFHIIPSNNTGLNATLRFYYDETELNGIPESELTVSRSADGSNNSWASLGGTINTAENYVEVTGLDDFSYWTLAGINSPLPVEDEKTDIPDKFELMQNYPNPFNPSTTIRFDVPQTGEITLKVFDILGKEVAQLLNEKKEPGKYKVKFDASKLVSGIYFYQIVSEKFVYTRKMILIK